MSELKNRITDDMKSAMKARDKESTRATRMILEAIKQKEVDDRTVLDDSQVITVINKMVKQRKDSISQFTDAGREDLIKVENDELAILNTYMPKQLSDEEIVPFVDKAINDLGASSMQDMGKLMGILKGQLDGKVDMGAVSQLIKAKLS
ncbi:MAG TPA: GatB/YqeY domain-containing protein [Gammaproteobacteria bacterium]|nr:GatB/YqeY domain-containing protein [Gammaproteobacteria bacterium]